MLHMNYWIKTVTVATWNGGHYMFAASKNGSEAGNKRGAIFLPRFGPRSAIASTSMLPGMLYDSGNAPGMPEWWSYKTIAVSCGDFLLNQRSI